MFAEICRGFAIKAELKLFADIRDGSMAVLIGIAARKSIDEQRPIKIEDLTDLKPRANKWLE